MTTVCSMSEQAIRAGARRSHRRNVGYVFILLASINSLVVAKAHQLDGPGAPATTVTAASQVKNFSEKPRSQREEPKSKQEGDKLLRRDGGVGSGGGHHHHHHHQQQLGASMVPANLAPPELGDNEYLAEDSTDSSTSPFAPEYEAEASDLLDIPNLQQASNLRHPFGHQQQGNSRPLRQSNNPMQLAEQHHNQQPMMMMATQQQPRMQQPGSMGPVVSVVSSTMATTSATDGMQSINGMQQPVGAIQNQLSPSRTVNTFGQPVTNQPMGQMPSHQAAASSFNVKQQPAFTVRSNALGDQDVTTTTESAAHELLSRVASQINERRLDLLYPSNKEDTRHHQHSHLQPQQQPQSQLHHHHQQPHYQHQQQADQQQHQVAREAQVLQPVGICYSTLALLAAMLASAAVTVLLCCATHFAVKHLGRHQFDLIAKNSHFESARGSDYLSELTANDPRRLSKQASGVLSAYNDDHNMRALQQRLRDEHGCAFDNPYFRDDATGHAGRNQNGQTLAAVPAPNYQSHPVGNNKDAPGAEQLNFIEHHISNLHNRQVTSSVKELSILDLTPNGSGQHVTQVVDLTSEEQRARVIADPKEGDLVAVDITGHDFIGLGFDVCGNQEEGIFVRSVLSRGPARESGCIHPGDRIKCLNISFDNITLIDACDILNCGSPYKLRLLLEKRAAPASKLDEKQRSQPAPVVRRLPRNNLAYRHQLLAASATGNPERRSTTGPISATRSYLRRLASLVSSSGTSSKQTSNVYCDQFGTQPPQIAGPYAIGDHQLLAPVYLGSAAARRQASSRSVMLQQQHGLTGMDRTRTQANSGCRSDGDESGDELTSVGPVNHHRRRMSHGDSFGSNLRAGRFSVDSSDLFGGSSVNDLALDSSIDFQSRNAHHRLHGPQTFEVPALRRDMDLRHVPSQEIPTNKVARRQSAPMTDHQSHSRKHLEQTQSQPEITSSGEGSTSKLVENDLIK